MTRDRVRYHSWMTEERILELQRILREECGQELTYEEVCVFARDVVEYFKILEGIARRVDAEDKSAADKKRQ